jgi:subtilisin family serine protease
LDEFVAVNEAVESHVKVVGEFAVRAISASRGLYVAEFTNVNQAMIASALMDASPRIGKVELGIRSNVETMAPNDPLLPNQWHIQGASVVSDGGARVEDAWDMGYSGAGVNIAFVEGGMDIQHPDLLPNFRFDLSVEPGEVLGTNESDFAHHTATAGVGAGVNSLFAVVIQPECLPARRSQCGSARRAGSCRTPAGACCDPGPGR